MEIHRIHINRNNMEQSHWLYPVPTNYSENEGKIKKTINIPAKSQAKLRKLSISQPLHWKWDHGSILPHLQVDNFSQFAYDEENYAKAAASRNVLRHRSIFTSCQIHLLNQPTKVQRRFKVEFYCWRMQRKLLS